MKNLRLASLALIVVLQLACGIDLGQSSAPPAEPPIQQPAAQEPPAQELPTQQPPTSAPVVTEAPAATEAPTATTTSGCNDRAQLVSQDPQDGGRVSSGISFEMVWKLENTGSCTWDSSYRLFFLEGAQLTGLKEVQPLVKNSIPPGSSLSIFITMRAPTTAGEFTATWQWVDGKGNFVPVLINSSQEASYITVRIYVP